MERKFVPLLVVEHQIRSRGRKAGKCFSLYVEGTSCQDN